MQLLEIDQIKQIENRISEASLKNTSLTIDILDHICCMIEDRLELGWDYIKAEKDVFRQMGVLQIQAIEQETENLTQNNITMKKRTKIIGLVSLILLVGGFIMKMLHLQGAAVTWGIGVLTAVFGFALFLTVDRFTYEQSSRGKILSIIGYLGSASFILGSGFKLLHMPGAYYLTAIGGVVLLIYFIANNSMSYRNESLK